MQFLMFSWVLTPLAASMGGIGSGLSVGDEFLLVLMKLSRSVTNQDLAYRLGIHLTKVTKIFHRWIDIMAENLKSLIRWSNKGMILSTLPKCFKWTRVSDKHLVDFWIASSMVIW